MKSIILTSVQFSCLAWILYSNPWIADHTVWIIIQIVGLAVGLWAIFEMSRSKLNVTPVPRKGAILITSGPYRMIRHPMYTGLILTFFPILSRDHGLLNLIVFSILLLNMLLKLSYEEQLLRERFPEYNKMTDSTWKLIPFIY